MRRMRHIKAREFQGCDVAYDFSNPSTLYDAVSGGSLVAADGAIARMEDLSGNGNHATQSAGASRPLRKIAYHNGVDVGLFDGSNDFMTAGDVADIRTNPVEFFFVARRTNTSNFYQGFFGKAAAGASNPGRWTVLKDGSNDTANIQKTTSSTGAAMALGASSSDMRIVFSHADRGSASSNTASRVNGEQIVSNTVDDSSPIDADSSAHLFIGAFQNSAGTAPLTAFNNGFLGGYIGEAAKWQREFTPATRRRFEHSRMRKWRISG